MAFTIQLIQLFLLLMLSTRKLANAHVYIMLVAYKNTAIFVTIDVQKNGDILSPAVHNGGQDAHPTIFILSPAVHNGGQDAHPTICIYSSSRP